MAPRYRVLSRPMLRVAGWFDPVVAESYEMLYQSNAPYLFDSGKFSREFGFAGTPYADGIRTTAVYCLSSGVLGGARGCEARRACTSSSRPPP